MFTHKSMATTFKHTKEDVEDRIKCGAALYGAASAESMGIADSVEVNLSSKLFKKGGQGYHYTVTREEIPVTYYSLISARPSVTAVCLGDASRDDLNLFACMANPDLLTLPMIKDAFFGRLSAIQAEEAAEAGEDMTAIHEAETAEFEEFVGYMEDTQVLHGAHFHKDYSPEKKAAGEYPQLTDVALERYRAGNYTEIVPLGISMDDTPTE